MARGKYGARAANRLAQTDNELLVATAAERDELKLKVASLTQELADAKASLSGAVIDEADKMSRKLIARARAECDARVADIESERDRNGIYVADKLWSYFAGMGGDGVFPRFFVEDLVPRLVPDANVNDFINARLAVAGCGASREARRHGMANIKRSARAEDSNDRSRDSATALVTRAALGDSEARRRIDAAINPRAVGE